MDEILYAATLCIAGYPCSLVVPWPYWYQLFYCEGSFGCTSCMTLSGEVHTVYPVHFYQIVWPAPQSIHLLEYHLKFKVDIETLKLYDRTQRNYGYIPSKW